MKSLKFNTVSILIVLLVAITQISFAQYIGIGTDTPDKSAILDVVSTDKGMLIPRTDTTSVNGGIVSPAMGLIIFQTTDNKFYYFDGSKWIKITTSKDAVFERNGTTIRQTGNYNDDFIIGRDKFPQNGVNLSDNLIFFDKSKAAFRGGKLVNSKNWSPDSIGTGSLAFGYNTKAKGENSTALGYKSAATGNNSTAWGNYSEATGNLSTVWGNNSNSKGYCSTVWGDNSEASGGNSTAWGVQSEASGHYSTAWGKYTKAKGEQSTAWGYTTEASGKHSTAWGYHTKAPSAYETVLGRFSTIYTPTDSIYWNTADRLFSIGNGTNSLTRSNALTIMKNGDFIIDSDSLPENGINTTGSFIFYDKSKAAFRGGELNNSKNWSPDSIGTGSFAFGRNTKAKGDYSTAWGIYSEARGDKSTAGGFSSRAKGDYSVAIGANANASSAYEVALGAYNTGYTPISRKYWRGEDRAFSIGNGGCSTDTTNGVVITICNYRTAFTILKNGKTGIGEEMPNEKLEVVDKILVSDGEKENRNGLLFEAPITGTNYAKIYAYKYGDNSGGKDIEFNTVGGGKSIFGGNVLPESHKGSDLGANGTAWDDIYYDDLHNQGAAAFTDRNVSEEILLYPPIAKKDGDFDVKTDKGLYELDPKSMPDALHGENSLLTDEISTYNYKANYEQQLQIEELKAENAKLKARLDKLEKLLTK